MIGPAATTSEVEQLISDDIPAAALVEINLRGGERAYGLIDRLHDQGVRVVVMSGYRTLPLAQGKAVAVLQKPMKNEQLFAAFLFRQIGIRRSNPHPRANNDAFRWPLSGEL